MEPAPPESKRPRLTSTSSWSTLPHPVPPPHHPSHASHAPPYHPTHPFTRPPESPAPLAQHHHDDRRHHEPEAFPPMQDHQRHHPPPSPAQQAHYHYPMREPMVKRDPNDEPPLSQLRRPNSTGHPVDNLPPTTHAPHHRPVQPPPEPPRQMSYENGPPMAQSPNAYRPPPTAFSVPPTPVPHHQHYDGGPYGHGGHVPPPMSYHPQIDIQQASSAKRKATRASQACDSCRQLKAKCDETKPCKTCRERNINCVFRDPQPKQTDKANADIMDYLAGLRDEMVGAISKVERRLTHVERAINSQPNATADCKIESIEGEDYHDGAGPMDRESLEDDREGQPMEDSNGGMDTEAAVTTLQKWEHNDSDEKPGPPVAGKTKLPANHTTSAGLLLKWTSIHDLVKRHLVAERIGYVEEFPIRQEKLRGLLRVCGSGEGSTLEPAPHADHSDHQRADNILTEYQDDNSEAPSPAPNSEVWGQTGGLSPAPGAVYRGGVINTDGNPDFSAPTVLAYVESFKNNILNMHPIMILEELDALVVLFLKEIPQHTNKSNMRSSSNSKFVSQPTSAAPSLPEAVGSKRKRSPGGDETMPSFNFYKPGHPFRSITSAVVLLVCALGKICLNKDRIPDVVTDYSEPQPHRSPSMRNGGAMSPIHGSPPGFVSHSQSSGLPSPQDYDRTMPSRRTSMQGNGTGVRPTQMKRNYDVIPGLEYFALATDIMGSHLGGMSLKHVYAWVLAGLYHGQLARAVESWAYIKQGCTVLQEIMRTSIYRFQEIKLNHGYVPVESRRDNQLLLAYWTCLQLESDILAELPLSQSPIMQHEDNMPYPNMGFVTGHGYKDEVCASYFAQLHLRRQLNEIHSHLYNPEKIHRPQSPETIDEGIEVLQTQLKTSRNIWVPPTFRWNEDEPAATDILSARLRAKYWGSQVIIYRPFVRHILEKAPIPYGAYKNPALPQPDSFKSLNIRVGNQPIPDGVDPRTLNYARLGIEALMESTSAFHGMPRRQRIIVTNIFGTAHAQWGNLLTLAACYQDPILSRFVEVETLAKLFNRTIEFFDVIAHRSSPLRSERNILYGLACDLRLIREDPPLNSSFSSMTSSTTPATTVTSHPGEMYPPSGSAAFAGHHPHTSRP